MKENLKKFLEEAGNNEELREKLLKITNLDTAVEETISVAKEYGFTLTEEDFEEETDSKKMSLDELDAVAGGETTEIKFAVGGLPNACFCFVIGAAEGCGCFVIGSSSG